MNSNGVYFYLVTALAFITVCYATGLEVFPTRYDDSKTTFGGVIGSGPVPDLPKFGTWSWPLKSDTPCVMVQFAIQMNISYLNADNKSTFVLYNIPTEQSTVPHGSCENETNSIQIQWTENNQSTNMITVEFSKNSTATQFSMSSIKFDLMLDNKTLPRINNATVSASFELRKTEFTTPIDMSYHCTKPQHFNLTTIAPIPDDDNKMNATFVIAHVQLEAFNTKKNNNQFATAKDCDAIDTPDIVPIAVGCALAGLIVIVLIAYLVGRRRAQARGYLSM
jgi:lysosomal-associated membrane protein 1/2